ncbi:helix-turn-helix domain-containing protein [Mesobacillus sp. S13]|uniref:helix-turn-helix domain-containing protein n=1 Tax=Mesobacillus sp. S13 TaxID=2880221 RepID=UPI001CF0F666|nr:helix-turn-helix transcriptional regulator [Mesobacillus sp. S13]
MTRKIVVKLDKHIKDKSQKQFAIESGLREATVSQLVNNKYDRIQLSNLLKAMDTLKIEDFNEILEIVEDNEKPTDQ